MATRESSLRPIGGEGGSDPDPPDALIDARLVSFTADPSSTAPFGPPVTLRWNVDMPSGPVPVSLNNVRVAKSGSMQVQPASTTTYRMTASMLGFTRSLGSLTVPVQTSACVTGTLSEAQVQDQLRAVIDALDAQERRFSQRRKTAVSIDAAGIKVAVRLSIAIDNFADPDLDVDFTLGLRVRDGHVEPFYKSFSVDLDWPWWVTTVSFGVTKIVEEIIEDKIEGELKPRILEQVRTMVNNLVSSLPANLKLYRIVTQQDAISITVCPVGDHLPHVVIGTPIERLPVLREGLTP